MKNEGGFLSYDRPRTSSKRNVGILLDASKKCAWHSCNGLESFAGMDVASNTPSSFAVCMQIAGEIAVMD